MTNARESLTGPDGSYRCREYGAAAAEPAPERTGGLVLRSLSAGALPGVRARSVSCRMLSVRSRPRLLGRKVEATVEVAPSVPLSMPSRSSDSLLLRPRLRALRDVSVLLSSSPSIAGDSSALAALPMALFRPTLRARDCSCIRFSTSSVSSRVRSVLMPVAVEAELDAARRIADGRFVL